MKRAPMGVLGRIAIALGTTAAVTLLTAPTWAQDHQPTSPAAEKIEFVKTGLFMVSGDGGNTAVRLTGNGIILVDGKLPGHYANLVSRAHAIADELPVRFIVLTGPDEQHTGTNGEFVRAGIPVVAQEHTKEILAHRSNTDEQSALPSVTFDQERTIKLGGVTVQLLYFGAARTSGDAVVYFPDLKVIAVGDLYTSATPVTNDGVGGNLEGWRAALQRILQLDFDTVIPGTGPIVQRADLEALATRIDKLAGAH